jgi:hypothetical protein
MSAPGNTLLLPTPNHDAKRAEGRASTHRSPPRNPAMTFMAARAGSLGSLSLVIRPNSTRVLPASSALAKAEATNPHAASATRCEARPPDGTHAAWAGGSGGSLRCPPPAAAPSLAPRLGRERARRPTKACRSQHISCTAAAARRGELRAAGGGARRTNASRAHRGLRSQSARNSKSQARSSDAGAKSSTSLAGMSRPPTSSSVVWACIAPST